MSEQGKFITLLMNVEMSGSALLDCALINSRDGNSLMTGQVYCGCQTVYWNMMSVVDCRAGRLLPVTSIKISHWNLEEVIRMHSSCFHLGHIDYIRRSQDGQSWVHCSSSSDWNVEEEFPDHAIPYCVCLHVCVCVCLCMWMYWWEATLEIRSFK